MGMGAGQQQQSQQQPSVGMQGKGGAARPAQQPAAGMGGKGVGQQLPQQSNLNNALTALGLGLGETPTYPFPQPPVQQPVQGMAGKGVGQLPPQSVQPGMGGKNVGQLPYDPIYMDRFPQVQPQSGMGGKGVGTRQIDPAMQPYVNNLVSGMQQAEPGVLDPSRYTNYDQPAPATGMSGKGVGGQLPPQAGTLNEALMGLNQPPVQVQPAPVQPTLPRSVQPATGMSGKGALRSAAKTPQPVRAEQQKVATQRLLQQLASRNRGRGRR